MSQTARHGFAHRRLDAFHLAQHLAAGAVRLSRELPRGTADLRDQIQRSALAVVRHIAEGAGRFTPADRRARFVIARGECAECDASLETAALLELADPRTIHAVRRAADRVGAMLTGLIRRETARIGETP